MNIIQLGQKDVRPFSELIRDDLTIESIIRDLRYIRNRQTSQED